MSIRLKELHFLASGGSMKFVGTVIEDDEERPLVVDFYEAPSFVLDFEWADTGVAFQVSCPPAEVQIRLARNAERAHVLSSFTRFGRWLYHRRDRRKKHRR